MALVGLVSPLATPEEIRQWSFQHARDHDEIDVALNGLGFNSPPVPLDPMPSLDRAEQWLLLHQSKHTTMNAAFGLTGGDLTKFQLSLKPQLDAFAGVNYSEHQSIHQTLAAQGVQISI